ncbi:MAG: helix-turn-helix transcriptional regulator [Dehalobacter sp.]|nr:helix-turn-helix transcriptional regulator [Dehalobacter sp.]
MTKNVVNRRLKGLMAENGVTIPELAKKMGISRSSLSRKINGRQTWYAYEICFITKYFGFSEFKNVFPELYNSVLTREAV